MSTPHLPLPHRARGRKSPPIVLAHGFGGDMLAFAGLMGGLSALRRTIAFDLPGHGKAVDYPGRADATGAAEALIASLDAMGIARAAFIGHSMGGAVASIVGLKRPDLVERLILVSPGGFGREMNVPLLTRYAAMQTTEEIAAVLDAFFGPASTIPDALPRLVAEQRADPALRASFATILGHIARGDGQGVLPLSSLAAAPFPVTLVWGEADEVVPVHQALAAPAVFARHLLPGVGHMPHIEAPETLMRIVALTLAGRAD
ncbi:alpha/beta fold hydrolase [Acuticoccus mangrovi]|uniref:Alpha/beta fold hydrolase n=1 Tax=Acuticoccus mangrovi TaxID=2796142 RepID=A0A934MG43_9HYPH|nr:alpha/beta fold hydrolase [Acuticoccus mangrovi]MBJ3776158.1 alpha/beta fold hydrolase [Acuticoccus mangrovi]